MTAPWVILKFGGSSVGSSTHWPTIVSAVNRVIEQGNRPFVVLSALKNVSNELEALLQQAISKDYSNALKALADKHLLLARELGIDSKFQLFLDEAINQLAKICQSIAEIQTITPKDHALVLAFGELLSTRIGALYLQKHQIAATWFDVRTLLRTHQENDEWHHFTSATCPFDLDPACQKAVDSVEVVVTQGFIAADANGETVLLGREGSDTSAAYLGAKLSAQKIEIWTDVAGVFSANPKQFSNTYPIERLSYYHAQLMARLGAKVLHPRAIEPAARYQIPVVVKSTLLPELAGTFISAHLSKASYSSLVGLAIEEAVTIVAYPLGVAKDDILMPILSQGFDLIENFSSHTHQLSAIAYHNSDVERPDDKQLYALIAEVCSEATIDSSNDLISLIGNFNDTCDMQLEAELKQIEKRHPGSRLQKINASFKDCRAILCKRESSNQVATKLHDWLAYTNNQV